MTFSISIVEFVLKVPALVFHLVVLVLLSLNSLIFIIELSFASILDNPELTRPSNTIHSLLSNWIVSKISAPRALSFSLLVTSRIK